VAVDDVIEIEDSAGGPAPRVKLTARIGQGVFDGLVLDPIPSSMWGVPTYEWARCVSNVYAADVGAIAGGATLVALADGNVVMDSGELSNVAPEEGFFQGSLILSRPAAVVHIGLSYNSDLESLNVAQEKGRQKLVKAVIVEYDRSRGGKVGQALDELAEVPNREKADDYRVPPLRSGEQVVNIKASWREHGRVVVRQDQPLPLSIVGLTRDFEYGGT
jgi:hypothetical protein